jgi:LmbE family N-acetylglucosaminyl deacetylase
MARLRMLACFAHPDDEAFSASGVLAASTARGVDVRLVCTTYGEEYLIQAHLPVTGDSLPLPDLFACLACEGI